jgi:DNA-binding HxlR family transcriptional regulator
MPAARAALRKSAGVRPSTKAPPVATPKIGSPVRGSTTGRPIMVALDLLGRRMTLRILWELRAAPLTFRALQEACQTNPSVLNKRLGELREAGLIEHAEGGYRLSAQGRKLHAALRPLSAWAAQWADD